MAQLDRITQGSEMTGAKACIRSMRVTVGMIGAGHSVKEILSDYLPRAGRRHEALRYTAWRTEEGI